MRPLLIFTTAFLWIALPVSAQSRDAVHFFSSITVAEGQEVHDAVCFFCSVDVEGTVTGDVVTFFGSSRISGSAEKDVVNFLGSTDVEGSVGKDLVIFLGSGRLGEGASAGHDVVVFGGSLTKASTATIGHDSVHFPGIIVFPLLLPFVIVGLVIYVLLRWLRDRREPVYPYPMPPPRR